jgi:hypothetical protein
MIFMVPIGADILPGSLPAAAFGLGLDVNHTSRIAIVRAALVLYKTGDRNLAREFCKPKKSDLGSNGQTFVAGTIEEEWADVGDTDRAHAIRVGLAMAAGLDRERAENWSRMHMRPRGRPQGSKDRKPRKRRSEEFAA